MQQALDVSHRILQAARQLFFARGFARTQLRAIAAEAGTSESGVLRIYESKTLLLRAVCESCWAEVNAEVDKALEAAAQRDDDPRSLLLEIMRTVLRLAQADKPMMTFLRTHFLTPEAIGSISLSPNGGDNTSLSGGGREFRLYMHRIGNLSAAVLVGNPAFASAGVSHMAMRHFVQSAIYGIQAGWYIADQEGTPEAARVTIEEGVACLRCLLYQNAAV